MSIIAGGSGLQQAGGDVLPVIVEGVPPELRRLRQWVLWRLEASAKGKRTKVPYRVDRPDRRAASTDPETWATFEAAVEAYLGGKADGIGFVFTDGDPYAGVDLDRCRDRETGELAAWAKEFLATLAGYAEVSPSGTGVKVFVRARWGDRGHKLPYRGGVVERYHAGRYFTVTGRRLPDCPGAIGEEDRSAAVAAVWAKAAPFAAAAKAGTARRLWKGKAEGANPFILNAGGGPQSWTDRELLDRMAGAANGAAIAALLRGDTGAHGGDHSAADLALCSHLWFWSGDRGRVDALFRQSGLMRAKWDERHRADGATYGRMTLDEACKGQVCGDRRPGGPAAVSGTQPDTGGQGALPWPDPLPLVEAPPVPAFPVEVLPAPLRRLVEETAWAMNTPPDLAAVPLLALAGGALANARHLRITRGHDQPPALYAVVVSPPGTAKSPVLKLLRRPLDRIQAGHLERFQREMDRWEQSDPEDRGPKPVPRRCVVSDITTESLGIVLNENPRGVVMVRDELAALVTGMNQYKGGKGSDRQTFLALWSGDPVLIDRKSEKSRRGAPLYVEDPFLGIVGTIQPDVAAGLRGEPVRGASPPDDGFLDRFLIVYPPRLPAVGETWRQVSVEAVADWDAVVERLLGLEMVREEGGRPRPFYVPLTECGRAAWERFTRAHAGEVNADDFPPHLVGAWSKLRGYAGRLALIVHYLRWACGEVRGEAVDGESLRRATALVDYFKAHARKVHAVMGADTRTPAARRVVRWITRKGRQQFSVRDAFEGLKGTYQTVEELESVLALVERRGIIRPLQTPERGGRGRPRSPVYEVHPSVLEAADAGTRGQAANGAEAICHASHASHNSQYSHNGRHTLDFANSANSANDVGSGERPAAAAGDEMAF